MDWDQIESKWAAMARRVRADIQYDLRDAAGRGARRDKGVATRAVISSARQRLDAIDARSAMPTK
jgi:hypothetical protein